ncbi:hypothetical protein HWD35_23725 [Tsukamurella tyrosinosolvens]|uniref:hypothetical protein n=1 Tax=Tsukamurella tyrosinosolvens TaxID=57704 RepID=UPI001CE12592|nr:hypothetical protein [Tsukamurella tyrosinosolvens]MCA4997733.1 hypothetical protein [Tsukamurella tyrosinosolvens]
MNQIAQAPTAILSRQAVAGDLVEPRSGMPFIVSYDEVDAHGLTWQRSGLVDLVSYRRDSEGERVVLTFVDPRLDEVTLDLDAPITWHTVEFQYP